MRIFCWGLLAFSLTTAGTSVQAAVVLSDDFEGRTAGSGDGNGKPAAQGNHFSEWGTNNNNLGGDRVAGYETTADRTGTAGDPNSGGANQVVGLNQFDAGLGNHGHLLNGGVRLTYSALADSPDGFTIGFTFDRNTDPADTSNGFIAFGLGIDPASGLGGLSAVSETVFGLLFQQSAGGFDARGQRSLNGSLDENDLANFEYATGADAPNVRHDVLLSVTPQVSGEYGGGDNIDVELFVDSNSVFVETIQGSDTRDMGQLSFSSNNASQRYIDNLVITAVPEPGGFAALALLGGMIAYRRRRR